MKHTITTAGLLLLTAAAAQGQQIDPDLKHAWCENIGWTNFADAGDPSGSQAVFVHEKFLEGYVWTENAGWINLGNGNGPYSNTDHTNFGVNLDPATGKLGGLAWGENVGWINFYGGDKADPPNPARLDPAARRFRGYAWGENVGWISLDDDEHYVALACPGDFNGDGGVNTLDVLAFLNAWVARDPLADFDGNGIVDSRDVLAFLNAWTAGC